MIRDKVFISYSRRDQEWLTRLRKMLKPLVRKGTISLWADTEIKAGADWKVEIENALASACVAILLVSDEFLASDFVVEEELPPLLRAAEQEGVAILWIYLSPCLYEETAIGSFQAAHDISKSLEQMTRPEQQQTLMEVGRLVRVAMAKADEARKRRAEAQAKQEAEAEKKRQTELAARRLAEAEKKRRAELAARRWAEAERKRDAELAARRQLAVEKKRQVEAEQKREAALAARRQEVAEKKRQAEAERKREAELAARRQLEEEKHEADAERKRHAGMRVESLAEGRLIEAAEKRRADDQARRVKAVRIAIAGLVLILVLIWTPRLWPPTPTASIQSPSGDMASTEVAEVAEVDAGNVAADIGVAQPRSGQAETTEGAKAGDDTAVSGATEIDKDPGPPIDQANAQVATATGVSIDQMVNEELTNRADELRRDFETEKKRIEEELSRDQAEAASQATRVDHISWDRTDEGILVTVKLNGELNLGRYVLRVLEYNPLREMIRIEGILEPYGRELIEVGTQELGQVRCGYHVTSGSTGELHLVFDYPSAGSRVSEVRRLKNRLEILVVR